MIKISNVSKKYGKNKVLEEINLKINEGEICGILGSNGAGKSTLIKILLGIVFPTSGEVEMGCAKENKDIGYMSENIALYLDMNAYDNILMYSILVGVTLTHNQILDILKEVSLPTNKRPAGKYSLGMKRRLQLACVMLVKEFSIIILDEPTNGLDLDGMIWFKDMLKKCQNRGQTILISTHAINDIQDLLSRAFIINKGKIASTVNLESEEWKKNGTNNLVDYYLNIVKGDKNR